MKTLTPPLLLFTLILCLVCVGIISVYSASASATILQREIVFAVVGIGLMLAFYCFDYHWLHRFGFWIMLAGFILCLAVFVPGLGDTNGRNAFRWINIFGFKFQCSEFAKVAMVIYMARMLSDRRQHLGKFFYGVVPAMTITGIFAIIIVIEPDLGAAFTLCLVIFGMWLAAEMRWFHLVGLVSAGIPALIAAIVIEPWRVKRVLAFLWLLFDPDHVDPDLIRGVLYNLCQSLIAVGSGGFHGLGLGQSLQRFHFPTEAHTDFIFAIMCEEWGFWKIALILGIYAATILTGWYIAWNIPDMFGSLLASGITLLFFVSATINMGVVLGLLPTKGLVLPFFSAGGSSLMMSMVAAGILMNIGRYQYTHQSMGRVR